MAFGKGKEISVLEAKFQIYEDLSKEMLDKLERAVYKISESNQNVALILERHENKLEQADRSDTVIMELVKDLRTKIDKIERKLEDIGKFRWMTVGIAVAAATAISSANIFGKFLTPSENNVNIREQIAIPR